ncbi:uncharacterized protein FA14DRAFT_155742 [Meira miltonrushii]|uniref:Uncharacterized protein n=1 Tax=Meira miltonrushii TaxID=1280837 RepID=A0A316VH31_9BASI|nr:uncharacterized protein FA14DRAFT_155742 [Meira miltonrushii]PWN36338.1 hypothetical protein FA14DRAFT_155742 [Meira miltonrushii]
MRFSIPVFVSAALALTQYASAEGLTGIKVPASITPGELFNVTYSFSNGLTNCAEYMAIFGMTYDKNVLEASTIGSQVVATADLSKLVLNRTFNATIRAPSHGYFEFYANYYNGTLPQPWYISSANIQQIGDSGGVGLEVFHASTHINYS